MNNFEQKRQYQANVNKLKVRKNELKTQYGQIQSKTQIVEDRIQGLQRTLKSMRDENVDLAQKIERKIFKHRNTLAKESKLKRDLENLEMSKLTLQTRYQQKAKELLELENKLRVMEEKKQNIMLKNDEQSRAQLAMNKRKKNIEKRLLNLDEELKSYEARLDKKIPSQLTELKKELRHHAGKDEKSAAIMMTLMSGIIRSMEENEFENLKYKYKVNSDDKRLGLRVRFAGVASTQDDIRKRIYPIMKAFKSFFREHGVSLKTKVGKANGDMIEILDIAIVMNREANVSVIEEGYTENWL
jgi:chromosome segregation ATPase